MHVLTFKKGNINELRIPDYDREYEIYVDKNTNKVISLVSNNYYYPCNGGDDRKTHEKFYIEGLNTYVKINDDYEGEFGVKERIEKGLKEFYSRDDSASIKDKVLCSHIFKEIVVNPISTDTIKEENDLRSILTKLYYNDKTALQDIIDKQNNHPEFNSIFGIRKLIDLEDGLEDKNLFEKVMRDFYYVDLNKCVNYVALREFGLLEDHIKDNLMVIDSRIENLKSEGLFIIRNEKTDNTLLVSDGEVIIYEAGLGAVATIHMDGKPFKFKGEEYPASIEGLKLIQINYFDKLSIEGDLNNLKAQNKDINITNEIIFDFSETISNYAIANHTKLNIWDAEELVELNNKEYFNHKDIKDIASSFLNKVDELVAEYGTRTTIEILDDTNIKSLKNHSLEEIFKAIDKKSDLFLTLAEEEYENKKRNKLKI